VATYYCTQDQIDDRYGATNVSAWADMEGLGTTNANISGRIDRARTVATAYINALLEQSPHEFNVPITGDTVPTLIEDACVKLSAYWLSTARGVKDYDEEGKPMTRLYVDYLDAMQILDKIAAGTLKVTIG
jgi:phage gp36-like protein